MFSSWKYSSVPPSISDGGKCEADWHSDSQKASQNSYGSSYFRVVTPWFISTVLFAVLATYFGYQSINHSVTLLPGPFRTDFRAAKPWIEYEERQFTGQLDYNAETGQAYRVIDPSQPLYFGEQSLETEAAWDGLLRSE